MSLSLYITIILQASAVEAVPALVTEPSLTRAVVTETVRDASLRFGMPEVWIKAVLLTESNGEIHAVSPKGALGLMQLMPGTWADMRVRYSLGTDVFNARDNILAGTAYLRLLYDRFGKDGFIAAYNAGPGRYEAHLLTGKPLPNETLTYVQRVYQRLGRGLSIPPVDAPPPRLIVWQSAPLFANLEPADPRGKSAPTASPASPFIGSGPTRLFPEN